MHPPITPEYKARINAAMEKLQGNMADAAKELGDITPKKLNGIIQGHQDLRERWKPGLKRLRVSGKDTRTTLEPGLASEIHREAAVPSSEEYAVAEALAREHSSLRKGFRSMGFEGDTLEMAMALQDFHRKHFRNVIDLLGGGMVKQYLEICNEVKKITEIINEENRNLPPEMYDVLRKDRQGLLDTIIQMYDRAVQAALVGAKIEFLRKNGTASGKKSGKPGFAPLRSASEPPESEPIDVPNTQ
jgi:hypothetical protein